MKLLDLSTGLVIEPNFETIDQTPIKNFEIFDVSPADLLLLSEKFNIDLIDLEEIFDEEERPRVDIDPQLGYMEIVLRYPLTYSFNSENKRSIPVITFFKPEFCIMIHILPESISLQHLKYTKAKSAALPATPHFNLCKIFFGLINQTEKIYKQYQQVRDDLETQIFHTKKTIHLRETFVLAKSIVLFENNANGNLTVIRRLRSSDFLNLSQNQLLQSKYDDIETDLEQYSEQLRIMRDGLNSSLDAYGSVVGNNINEVMKVLTVYTIILSTPTLIASLYGMNVSLPFQDDPAIFFVILVCSMLFSILLLFFMFRRDLV